MRGCIAVPVKLSLAANPHAMMHPRPFGLRGPTRARRSAISQSEMDGPQTALAPRAGSEPRILHDSDSEQHCEVLDTDAALRARSRCATARQWLMRNTRVLFVVTTVMYITYEGVAAWRGITSAAAHAARTLVSISGFLLGASWFLGTNKSVMRKLLGDARYGDSHAACAWVHAD